MSAYYIWIYHSAQSSTSKVPKILVWNLIAEKSWKKYRLYHKRHRYRKRLSGYVSIHSKSKADNWKLELIMLKASIA